MNKTRISSNASVYPMPMTLVGTIVEGRSNFMTAAWVTRVNYEPPLIAVAIGNSHHTQKGMREHRQFSVNIPGEDMIEATDYCGLVSGTSTDKSTLFQTFYGELEFAPMIADCPVTMECRVLNSIPLPADTLFIGEITGAYASTDCLTDGEPDARKIRPFVLTMPDNNYWILGEQVGKAWHAGKSFRP